MRRVGVVLIVVGIIVAVVGFFPKLAGEKAPEPGFGPQQTVAVIVGAVLFVIGIILCAVCGKCAAKPVEAPAEAAPPAEPGPAPRPPAGENKPETPAE